MLLVICRDCEGDPVFDDGKICGTCDGECVYHVESLRVGEKAVPCGCERCRLEEPRPKEHPTMSETCG
jgi:hypothetical protein